METLITDITALSSKGQLVLPKSIRESLSLETGCKFMVFADGDNILLKPIKTANLNEFDFLMDVARKWAEEVDMKESDIKEAIKAVRKNKR